MRQFRAEDIERIRGQVTAGSLPRCPRCDTPLADLKGMMTGVERPIFFVCFHCHSYEERTEQQQLAR